jgi:hypothetical protein
MWSHFILALSLLATFIECRPESEHRTNKPKPVYEGEEVNLIDYSTDYSDKAKKLHTLEVISKN